MLEYKENVCKCVNVTRLSIISGQYEILCKKQTDINNIF